MVPFGQVGPGSYLLQDGQVRLNQLFQSISDPSERISMKMWAPFTHVDTVLLDILLIHH
jgi:hypothetical protein